MEIQNYLRNNGNTLTTLETEYGVTSNICEELGVVSLNYSQISSDLSNPICQEARALILELDTWDVVSRSFNKFFNWDEPLNKIILDKFDWDSANVYEKLDGTLISLYNYKNKWNIATRKVANASGNLGHYDTTFRDLTIATMEQMKFSFDELNPNVYYSFELTTPLNPVVVQYDDYNLTLLAAWDKTTLQEIPLNQLPDLTAPKVKLYPLSNLSEIQNELNKYSPKEKEGFVIVDKNFNRMKFKSDAYLSAFRVVTSAESSTKNKIELIIGGHYDDCVGLLPNKLKDELNLLKDKFGRLQKEVEQRYEDIKHIADQKAFALEAIKYPYSSLLFAMRKSNQKFEELLDTLKINYLESLLEKFEK